jgi:amidase
VSEWWRHSAEELAGSGASAVEILDSHLSRIAQLDPGLNAMSVVLTKWAHAEAAARDGVQASGEPTGPLHGVPVVIKEEIDVSGCVTTFGGRGNEHPARADAEVVRRLREAGAVIVGKTTMPEFGAFPYTESDAFGVTRNPWHRGHTPGGSSGGTAVAVATGMAAVGMGGDGGGSIRIPAACVGLFGLKPQRGRVTTAPHEHLWWALGTAGPLSRTVRDSALVYDVIRGNVGTDLFRAGETGSFLAATERAPGRLRIGWSARPASPGIRPDPVHVAVLEETARLLADLGHDVREVHPHYPDSTAAFVPQFFAGIRTEADAVDHFDRLERRTRETVRLGGWVGPTVIDRAVAASLKVSAKANRVFDDIDVLMTPTLAHRPPRVGLLGGAGTVRSMLAAMPAIAYTALWNVAGNPAASVPCGLGPDGLPTAVQLVGRTDDEPTLLSLAAQLEQARPWPLFPAARDILTA